MPDLPTRRRPPGPDWFRPIAARLTPSVKTIVIAQACIYFFYVFVRGARVPMERHLAIGPGLFAGEVWQPLTSLFVNIDFLGFVFALIGLTFVGAFVERAEGTRRFFAFFVIAGVLANVTLAGVWRLRGGGPIPYSDGPGFSTLAMFVAFARLHGRTQAQLWPLPFAVQARYLVLIIIGWFVAMSVANGNWPALPALAVTCLVGYLGAGPLNLRQAWLAYKARRLRSQYRVLEGGRKPKKKYLN
jgi:membrane associated rhomboid family serine protease